MPYNNLNINYMFLNKNKKIITIFTNLKKPSTKFALSTVFSFCDTKVGRFCCTWAWTWVASLKRKASLRPRKVCGCRSLDRGWQLGVGRDAMDVALYSAGDVVPVGLNWINVNASSFFKSRRVSQMRWTKNFQKPWHRMRNCRFGGVFLGCLPQNDINEWPNQDSQKLCELLPSKMGTVKHHSNCLSTSNRSNEAVKAYSAASVDQLFPEAHRMMLEIKQKIWHLVIVIVTSWWDRHGAFQCHTVILEWNVRRSRICQIKPFHGKGRRSRCVTPLGKNDVWPSTKHGKESWASLRLRSFISV